MLNNKTTVALKPLQCVMFDNMSLILRRQISPTAVWVHLPKHIHSPDVFPRHRGRSPAWNGHRVMWCITADSEEFYWHENQTETKVCHRKKTALHGNNFLRPFLPQETEQVKAPVSIYTVVHLKINCQKATHTLVCNLRRKAISSPINQSAKERNLLSRVMVVVVVCVFGGGVIKCVWFEAPIAQNLSAKSLENRYATSIRAGGVGQIASRILYSAVICWISLLSVIRRQQTASLVNTS